MTTAYYYFPSARHTPRRDALHERWDARACLNYALSGNDPWNFRIWTIDLLRLELIRLHTSAPVEIRVRARTYIYVMEHLEELLSHFVECDVLVAVPMRRAST
jgi:hypothetical protein